MERSKRVLAALVVAFATLTAARCGREAPLANPYLALTEADLTGGPQGAGCSCAFTHQVGARQTQLFMLYGGTLTSRTRAGRRTCPIDDAQVAAIDAGRGTLTCDGRRLVIKTGNGRRGANDDTGADARITVEDGSTSVVLRGGWGCAC